MPVFFDDGFVPTGERPTNRRPGKHRGTFHQRTTILPNCLQAFDRSNSSITPRTADDSPGPEGRRPVVCKACSMLCGAEFASMRFFQDFPRPGADHRNSSTRIGFIANQHDNLRVGENIEGYFAKIAFVPVVL
jgi:hypothetical protein